MDRYCDIIYDVDKGEVESGGDIGGFRVKGWYKHKHGPDIGTDNADVEEGNSAGGVDEVNGDEGENCADGEDGDGDRGRGAKIVDVKHDDIPIAREANESLCGLGGGLAKLIAAREQNGACEGELQDLAGDEIEDDDGEGGQDGEGLKVDDVIEQCAVVAGGVCFDVGCAGEGAVRGVDENGKPVELCEEGEAWRGLEEGEDQGVHVYQETGACVEMDEPGGYHAPERKGNGLSLGAAGRGREGARGVC